MVSEKKKNSFYQEPALYRVLGGAFFTIRKTLCLFRPRSMEIKSQFCGEKKKTKKRKRKKKRKVDITFDIARLRHTHDLGTRSARGRADPKAVSV